MPRLAMFAPASPPEANWPFPNAKFNIPRLGVKHYWTVSSTDGTAIELFDYDFSENPQLHLQIYDQDEDDETPLDNSVHYWNMGVLQAINHLHQAKKGTVIAAWNGLFFDLNGQGSSAIGSHLTPVVINGELRYPQLPTYRWTFGVKYPTDGYPQFSVKFMPSATELTRSFDYCSGAAQCVIKDGKPLKLEPYPASGQNIPKPHGATPAEAGYIPMVDHMKVSRTSLGWSKDNRHLYMLFVKAPGTETESALSLRHGEPYSGGWTLADVQRFWISKGVWCAINSDGGGPAQLAYLRKDGSYTVIPPRWSANNTRLTMKPDATNAPRGGSLMYFYVRDASK